MDKRGCIIREKNSGGEWINEGGGALTVDYGRGEYTSMVLQKWPDISNWPDKLRRSTN